MLKTIEAMGSGLLERLVPKADAAAAAAPCYKCFTGPGCSHTRNHWWSYSTNCTDGWVFIRCDACI
ncbi:hypothetical protein [Streptomyces jumonjinensis]|uniref:hypothetical protein n=1 Tax=Streptomyces jumonjinensis TaxID=1945 RepID=UPI0037A6515D